MGKRFISLRKRRRTTGTFRRSYLKSGGLPSKKIVKMRYCEQIVLQSTSGTVATQVYWANGIYDPNYTGVGHQPLGHDEWAVLYNNYKVLRSNIKVQAGNTNAHPVLIAINRQDDPAGSTGNLDAVCEQPNTKWMQISATAGGPTSKTLKMGYVSRKQYPSLGKDDTLRPAFGASPSEGCYYVVKMQSTDAGQTINIPCLITIEYIVELTVPKILVQS